jgi:hypothetical protein
MRQTISGLLAAIAVMVAGAAPAEACDTCSPCGYVSPCAQPYVQPYVGTYYGCGGCGATFERLPDPEAQYHSAPAPMPRYYYVDQGPTYTGPGNFAPYRVYREGGVTGWRAYHHHRHYPWHHHHWHRYGGRPVLHSYY